MPIAGRLELSLKINGMPSDVATVTNGWKQFSVLVDEREIQVTVRPKTFAKLEEAKAKYPQWVAAIAGKLGPATEKGFILLEPTIQVFESRPKPQREGAPEAQAAPAPAVAR